MVGLKKFFQEKTTRPATSLGLEGCGRDDPYYSMAIDSPARSHFDGFPSRESQSLDVAHHFDQIEKQFEDLHDRLDRPTSSQSQLPPATHFNVPKSQNGRYIDLMDALTSSERPQTTTPESLSPPVSPYNEDIAERNMTRFLRIQYRNGLSSSRILSALYQEDVADRNIAKYSNTGRTMSSLSCRSSPAAPGRVRIPEGQRRKSRKRDPGKPTWASAENLRTNASKDDGSGTPSKGGSGNSLRPRRSAPSLCADEGFIPQEDAPPSPVQRLGVPPAYKQGKRWSNTPLPDSPTIPIPTPKADSSDATKAPSVPKPPSTIARSSSLTPRSISPSPSSGSGSKKNARGLSINTQLATQGRPKIAHRAIQPPTPSTSSMKRAPSIAEVMNSPLPFPSPISPPKSFPGYKASELMDLFTKAYMSAQGSLPTYESLHDAIVREINSHEAFRRVPVPAPGPPFTPSPEQGEFGNASRPAIGLNRSFSTKSRMNKNSFTKHNRTPESRRSISTSVGYDRLLRKVSGSPARRRHTDAPPPSPGFLAEFQPKNPAVSSPVTGEPITYMDVLRASSDQHAASSAHCASPHVSRKRGRSDSVGNLAAIPRSTPDMSPTPKTVYCMQAHSTPSSNGSHEDSDDDIIHLPSLTMPLPRVQIEGVDENNVRYVIDAASPDDAQKLMYWPQRIRGGVGSKIYGNSLSPLSRARMQLRGSRSVESY
ncbi:uncharacterized protein N7529_002460 [Penicillium soppii]|jgi:hypothetical protein|uniref:uncharacterized protein n=1 Tax=Penicillium soppii TaxID=69789 RepID=UPI0025494529|nr:uncharacterized protein N7529_002460 [Penicillium soppii]KAJ5874030.1 hypothetical protein N7529_002460 [Penicillium soppii]